MYELIIVFSNYAAVTNSLVHVRKQEWNFMVFIGIFCKNWCIYFLFSRSWKNFFYINGEFETKFAL